MLLAVGATIVASFTHFDPHLAFTFPKDAFHLHGPFFIGLGAGLIIAIYDYLGYNTTAYMGGELRDPGRVLPRSIIYSILGMMVIYLLLNVGVLGVMPWQQIGDSKFIGSAVLEQTWGLRAAQVFTALIVVTAFASVFTGLLGGSRVPFNASRDRLFFPVFARLHRTGNFPHVALLVMGAVTAIGSFFKLDDVINMLTAVTVLVQGVAQVIALVVLRRRQRGLSRPYRMFLYPIPAIVALVGWCYLYYASGWKVILLSLVYLALGVVAFLVWAYVEKTWPFGPNEIREEFLDAQERRNAPAACGLASVSS
jgi:amino acid transporter